MEGQNDIEKVEPYDPKAFELLKAASLDYIHFAENEQKKLIVTSPQNVKTSRFGEQKLMLRFQVLYIDNVRCDPPKKWDISNMKLIEQIKPIIALNKPHYNLVVKRGIGGQKSTNYTVLEV